MPQTRRLGRHIGLCRHIGDHIDSVIRYVAIMHAHEHAFGYTAYTLHDRAGTHASIIYINLLVIYIGVWLQIFHMTKVIVSDLRNCCSDEDSSTAPWFFFSSLRHVCKQLFLCDEGTNQSIPVYVSFCLFNGTKRG